MNRAERRASGQTNAHRPVSLVHISLVEDGKSLVRLVPSTRAVKRVSGGRTRG